MDPAVPGVRRLLHWPTSDEHQQQIWGWIHDDHSVEALVAVPVDEAGIEAGEPQGLAHLASGSGLCAG